MSEPTIETTNIDIPFPEAAERQLRLAVGACQLRIVASAAAGAETPWVAGTYRYPADTLPLKIEQAGGSVRISQEQRYTGIWGGLDSRSVPRFDLALGKAQPYALVFEGGASENILDLGGLPLTRFSQQGGAGKFEVSFSAPNPQPMSTFNVEVGAAAVEMRNLANANFAEMSIKGGATGYKLDFGGLLQRDARVEINTGMAGVEVYIPSQTAARVSVETVLGGVDLGDGFMKKEGAYWNEAALTGKTPVLTVHARIALGELKLQVV